MFRRLLLTFVCIGAARATAHDTWVETSTNMLRPGDAVYVDLMLGNHGNGHRDFKLAGKIDLASCHLEVLDPAGKRFDMIDRLVDTGYAPREGYWTGKYVPNSPGMYMVAHTLDKLHRTKRAIKSSKTFFVVTENLDAVGKLNLKADTSFSKPLGHALELVPDKNPVLPMGPGRPIAVRLLFRGEPLEGERVSFIPRGAVLSEQFDDRFERKTDKEGSASYTPTEGNYVLVVAHHARPDEKGAGYDATNYSATMTVLVPEACPCCEGEDP